MCPVRIGTSCGETEVVKLELRLRLYEACPEPAELSELKFTEMDDELKAPARH